MECGDSDGNSNEPIPPPPACHFLTVGCDGSDGCEAWTDHRGANGRERNTIANYWQTTGRLWFIHRSACHSFYAFGGFVPPQSGPPAWVPINNAWEYDPAHDSWKALAAMPSARGSAVAATVNGKIYVIGGAAMHPGSKEAALYPTRPHRSVGTVEEYDPKTNSWSERSSMPTARNHAAVGAVNNKIYVIGGRLGSAFIFTASNTNVVEEYDPATDQWGLVRARMPTERSGGAWGVYNGRIYVAGGEHQDGHLMAAFRALEAYDPATNSWSGLPMMPMPRHGLAGAVVGHRLHLASGDIQSAGITGMHVVTDAHDIFEFSDR